MGLRRAGIAAYLVEAETLGGELVALANAGVADVAHRDFLSFYGELDWRRTLAELGAVLGQSGRVLSERAACALCDAVRRAGTPLGGVDVGTASFEAFRPWAERWFPQLLGVPDAAERALEGGFLELRGTGRFELGALPLELLRGVDGSARHDDAWAEQLLEVLRSAQRLAPAHADTASVVFVPDWREVEGEGEAPSGDGDAPRAADASRAPKLTELLRRAVEAGASDLLLTAGRPPLLRLAGRLVALEGPPLDADQVRLAASVVLTDAQVSRLEREQALRASFGVRGLGWFRTSLFFQKGCLAASIRVFVREPTPEALGLPPAVLAAVTDLSSGVVLVVGPAGSGRTTTASALAAALARAGRSVLTIEEPLELVLPHGEGVLNQVEVGADGPSFEAALRVARDSEAEVVLLDHVDDAARLEAAFGLAAQGRLVLTTTSTPDASDARGRRASLALLQRLVPGEGGRTLSVQLLRP